MKKINTKNHVKNLFLVIAMLGSIPAFAETPIDVVNGSFETGNADGWNPGMYVADWLGNGTQDGTYCGDIWGAPMVDPYIAQTLTVPNGSYKVTCLLSDVNDDNGNRVVTTTRLYANNNSTLWAEEGYYYPTDLEYLKNGLGEKLSFAGYPTTGVTTFKLMTVYTEVTDGTLTIGVKTNGHGTVHPFSFQDPANVKTSGYCKIDNFKVYAVGNLNAISDLSDISITPKGKWDVNFAPNIYEYNVILTKGTKVVVPNALSAVGGVTITGTDPVDVSSGSGKSTIVCTALDGVTKSTYTINYTITTEEYPTFFKVANAPVIDGKIDAMDSWSETNWIDQNEKLPSGTTDAMKSKFQLTHDADNIYIAAIVEDATPNNDATAITNAHERDCVEFFIGMTQTDRTAYETGDWQIRLQRSASSESDYVSGRTFSGWNVDELTFSNDFQYKVISNATGYVVEAQLPKALLIQESVSDGENIMFEIQTADNTTGAAGGRTQQMFWKKPTDQQWSNPSHMTKVTLVSEILGVYQLKNNMTLKVINGVISFDNVKGKVCIYNTNGVLVRAINANIQQNISVKELNKGVYIVKGEGFVSKIIL